MKTLKEKNSKKTVVKWLGYFVAAYMLASWGVNGVTDPLHYLRNAKMQTEALEIAEGTDGIVIGLPEDSSKKGLQFLSFRVVESQEHSFDLRLLGHPAQGDVQEVSIRAWKGWNTVDLGTLQGEDTWTEIVVPRDAAGLETLILKDAGLSEYRKVDTKRMVYIAVSFLLLAVFWECVWWVKEKYAE